MSGARPLRSPADAVLDGRSLTVLERIRPLTQKGLAEYGRHQVIQEEQQLDSAADAATGCPTERNDGFSRELPGYRHVRQSGIRCCCVLATRAERRIEGELDQGNPLFEGLFRGRPTRETVGQIQSAVFERMITRTRLNGRKCSASVWWPWPRPVSGGACGSRSRRSVSLA